jgi:hypothetical protein
MNVGDLCQHEVVTIPPSAGLTAAARHEAQPPDLTARPLSRGRIIRGARVTFRNQELQT